MLAPLAAGGGGDSAMAGVFSINTKFLCGLRAKNLIFNADCNCNV